MDSTDRLIQGLFETRALRVCPDDKPFWYTSGTIGPYYVNTHFLYGSESKAKELLDLIDRVKDDYFSCPETVLEAVRLNYLTDEIFTDVIDILCAYIKKEIGTANFAYISGGERRDWFFSLILAEKLGKPHLTIYKDLTCVLTCKGKTEKAVLRKDAPVLHIADLVTEASSFERAWVPAIKELGGQMKYDLVVVDRRQGGAEKLAELGVSHHAMIGIDKALFDRALSMGMISAEQYGLIMRYMRDPKGAMREFLLSHPAFIKEALGSGGKTAERAELCVEKDFYGIADTVDMGR